MGPLPSPQSSSGNLPSSPISAQKPQALPWPPVTWLCILATPANLASSPDLHSCLTGTTSRPPPGPITHQHQLLRETPELQPPGDSDLSPREAPNDTQQENPQSPPLGASDYIHQQPQIHPQGTRMGVFLSFKLQGLCPQSWLIIRKSACHLIFNK